MTYLRAMLTSLVTVVLYPLFMWIYGETAILKLMYKLPGDALVIGILVFVSTSIVLYMFDRVIWEGHYDNPLPFLSPSGIFVRISAATASGSLYGLLFGVVLMNAHTLTSFVRFGLPVLLSTLVALCLAHAFLALLRSP